MKVADEDATTMLFEAGTLDLNPHDRPSDPRGSERLLARLERNLIGESARDTPPPRYVLLQQIGAGGWVSCTRPTIPSSTAA